MERTISRREPRGGVVLGGGGLRLPRRRRTGRRARPETIRSFLGVPMRNLLSRSTVVRLVFACSLTLLFVPSAARPLPAGGETGPAKPDWAPLSFLLGDWQGEGIGNSGEFSLHPDLSGNVLVRRNLANTPGGRHEDLMVIYPETPGFRAIYFDNEGHVLHYRVATAESQAVFTSEEGPGPRFRLTYRKNPDATVRIVFEIAPPGGTAWKTYIEGSARRK